MVPLYHVSNINVGMIFSLQQLFEITFYDEHITGHIISS